MKRRAVIERAIGETRAAVYEGRKLVELHLDRWSAKSSPKVGERWTGRVVTVDNSMAGAFVSLGSGPDSFLPFRAQKDLPRLTDGMAIDVMIAKEAVAEKGPVLRYAGAAANDTVGPVTQRSLEDRLSARFPGLAIEDASVGIIDTAVERSLAVPGGGSITIDRTQALIAVDVDKGGQTKVIDLCLNAATLILSQLRLRGLGGLVIIDFPNLRQSRQRGTITRHIEDMGEADPANVRIAPFSRFGVLELTRGTDGPSLDEKLNDRFGEPTIETRSLRALRRLEREGKANAGAQLVLTVPPDVHAWLDAAPFDWHADMTDRLGARFSVALGKTVDVSADR